MSMALLSDLCLASAETLYMVFLSTLIAILIGLPLGTLLFLYHKLYPAPKIYQGISAFINIVRSIPFIILLVALIPLTRAIIGTSIGLHAAIVPLSLGAAPFFGRLVYNAYLSLPPGLLQAGFAMGASRWQIIRYILLPEALPNLIQAVTVTAITLVNYSAMAGTIGGGGLGDLAIRYGYQRFDTKVILATVIVLVLLVQILQFLGDRLASRFSQHS